MHHKTSIARCLAVYGRNINHTQKQKDIKKNYVRNKKTTTSQIQIWFEQNISGMNFKKS